MKRNSCIVLCLTALALAPAFGQPAPAPAVPTQPPRPPQPGLAPAPTPAPAPSNFSDRLQKIIRQAGEPEPAPALSRFNLDFPGGTPRELVAAIEKAMGRPLNAIVPDELADTKLPALKMTSVDISQLFSALRLASQKTEIVQNPGYGGGYSTHQTAYGFRTEGKLSDDSIWYFYAERPIQPPPPSSVCRFYSLAPYLDRGATVDDITTAIETGWKMLGETSPPKISFHKDTKLLIAVGEASKLETIDAVLKALGQPGPSLVPQRLVPMLPSLAVPPSPPAPRPAQKPNSEN
jgi:hypothetical protein